MRFVLAFLFSLLAFPVGAQTPAYIAGSITAFGDVLCAGPMTGALYDCRVGPTAIVLGATGVPVTINGAVTVSTSLASSGAVSGTTITGSAAVTGTNLIPTGSSGPTVGVYLPAAGQLGLIGTTSELFSGATDVLDYGVTTAAVLTLPVATTVSNATVIFSGLTTDSAKTTRTVCQQTSNSQLFFGSGAAGICAGTSSIRFKHDIAPLDVGLPEIMSLQPVKYRLNADHGDPDALLYGFTAEQGGKALPQLMHRDEDGNPNTFDYMGVVPVLVAAVKQQQAEIDALKNRWCLGKWCW